MPGGPGRSGAGPLAWRAAPGRAGEPQPSTASSWGFAFVIADLAGALVLAIWSWGRAWGRIPLRPDLHLASDLIRRSSWLFLIWVVIQLVTYVDIFIIEVFGNTEEVGLYSGAWRVAFRTNWR